MFRQSTVGEIMRTIRKLRGKDNLGVPAKAPISAFSLSFKSRFAWMHKSLNKQRISKI